MHESKPLELFHFPQLSVLFDQKALSFSLCLPLTSIFEDNTTAYTKENHIRGESYFFLSEFHLFH